MFIFDHQANLNDGSIGTIGPVYKSFFEKENLNKYEFVIKGNFFYIILLGKEYSKKDIYGNPQVKVEKKILLRKPLKK